MPTKATVHLKGGLKMLYVLLGIGIFAVIGGVCLGIYFKFFSPDDFSMWNNKMFGKDPDKDQSYLDK